MRVVNVFGIVLTALVLVLGSFQLFSYFYFPNYFFNEQVENHLVSVVEGKAERLDDYFLERLGDVEFLTGSGYVARVLGSKGVVDVEAALRRVKFRSGVICDQAGVFFDKYSDMSFADLGEDSEFLGIVERGFGLSGRSYLVDLDTSLDDYFYVEDCGFVTEDLVRVGIGVDVSDEEYKRFDVEDDEVLRRFVELGGYVDLGIVSDDGFVGYVVFDGLKRGVNLNSFDGALGEAYREVLSSEGSVVFGPYLDLEDGEGLRVVYMSRVSGEGFVYLVSDINEVDEAVVLRAGLGESGVSYLVDSDKFLISSSSEESSDFMIQSLKDACLGGEGDVVYSFNYEGEEVLSSFVDVDLVDWCLGAEISSEEVFDLPKEGRVWVSVLVVLFLVVLMILGEWVVIKFIFRDDAR